MNVFYTRKIPSTEKRDAAAFCHFPEDSEKRERRWDGGRGEGKGRKEEGWIVST